MSYPKATCPNCAKITEVRPPRYRCKHCMYPIQQIPSTKHEGQVAVSSNVRRRQQQTAAESKPSIANARETIFERLSQRETAIRIRPAEIAFTQHNNAKALEEGRQEAAWLVVHMPDQSPHVFTLYVGENTFGRPSKKYIADLPLQDEYISRAHAIIHIERDNLERLHFRLVDDGSKRDGRVSANGTYVNGITKRIPQDGAVFLQDGDLIQVGYTILVFKSKKKTSSIKQAVAETNQLPYADIIKQNREE